MSPDHGLQSAKIVEDEAWQHARWYERLPIAVDRWDAEYNVDICRRLRRLLPSPGLSFLEVGCAPGRFMVLFAREFGCKVSGVELTAEGCEVTRENLRLQAIEGEVWQADFLDETSNVPTDTFDIVFTHGVVEHFSDLDLAIRSLARYCRKGGLVVTSVPNLGGLRGRTMRKLSPTSLDDLLSPVGLGELADAHTAAGLEVLWTRPTGAWRVGPRGRNQLARKGGAWRLAASLFGVTDTTAHLAGLACGWTPPNRLLSPRLTCLARKPF